MPDILSISSFGRRVTADSITRQLLQNQADANLQWAKTAFARYAAYDIMRNCGTVAMKTSTSVVTQFGRVFTAAITRDRERRLVALHTQAGRVGTQAIVEAYRGRPNQTQASLQQIRYRPGERDTGRLLDALGSDQMFAARRDGLLFIDPDFLDKRARQWYRLNFGAGSRGETETPRSPTTTITLFGITSPVDYGLQRNAPSAPFSMPPGYFGEFGSGKKVKMTHASRGQHQFFFKGRGNGEPIPTLGIAGSKFLDQGAVAVTRELGFLYTRLMQEWVNEAKKTGGGVFAHPKVDLTPAQVREISAAIRPAFNALPKAYRRNLPY